ncbi:hypothetical protein XENTR_v10000792 [Xenopus tropicalis]|nr:hypothetical protein XENTR_v10000792 [Xenopus tropicalis]
MTEAQLRYFICFLHREGYDNIPAGTPGIQSLRRGIVRRLRRRLRRDHQVNLSVRVLQRLWSDIKRRHTELVEELRGEVEDEWLQVEQGDNGAEAEAPPAPAQDPQPANDQAEPAPPAAPPAAPEAPPGARDAASQTGGANIFLDLLQEVRQEVALMREDYGLLRQDMALMGQDVALMRQNLREIQEAILSYSPPLPPPPSPPPPPPAFM